jgi:outer membrane murein-binding lipoprotein Lpp
MADKKRTWTDHLADLLSGRIFNTLIHLKEALNLERDSALYRKVTRLAKELDSMKSGFDRLAADVERLEADQRQVVEGVKTLRDEVETLKGKAQGDAELDALAQRMEQALGKIEQAVPGVVLGGGAGTEGAGGDIGGAAGAGGLGGSNAGLGNQELLSPTEQETTAETQIDNAGGDIGGKTASGS